MFEGFRDLGLSLGFWACLGLRVGVKSFGVWGFKGLAFRVLGFRVFGVGDFGF